MTGQRNASRASRQVERIALGDLGQRRFGLRRVHRGGDAGRQVVRVERKQDRGRLERVQRPSPGRPVPADTGRNRFRRCRSRCRGAGRRPGWPAADASACRTRAPPAAPVWSSGRRAAAGTSRRSVSSSALVSTKLIRALASATASSQGAGPPGSERRRARQSASSGNQCRSVKWRYPGCRQAIHSTASLADCQQRCPALDGIYPRPTTRSVELGDSADARRFRDHGAAGIAVAGHRRRRAWDHRNYPGDRGGRGRGAGGQRRRRDGAVGPACRRPAYHAAADQDPITHLAQRGAAGER